MNQNVVIKSDPVRNAFDGALDRSMDSVRRYLGRIDLSLEQVDSTFVRTPLEAEFKFSFRNGYPVNVFNGPVSLGDVPYLDESSAIAHVKVRADKLIKEALSPKNLRSQLYAGRADDTWRFICDSVEAVTEKGCGGCARRGTVTCGGCHGHGAVNCQNCMFSSFPAGNVSCWACYGQGGMRDTGTGKWCPCSQCRGWKYLPCSSCSGTTQIRCTGCAGHGEVQCSGCAGHGFHSVVRGYQIEMAAGFGLKAKGMVDEMFQLVVDWVGRGMPSRALKAEATLPPYCDVEQRAISFGKWENGILNASLPCSIQVTQGMAIARCLGDEVHLGYMRLDEDIVRFDPFLDGVIAELGRKASSESQPSGFLEAVSSAPGVLAALRASVGAGGAYVASDARRDTDGAVSAEAAMGLASAFHAVLRGYERVAVRRAAWDAFMLVGALWLAFIVFGGYDYLGDLGGRNVRIAAFVGLALVIAVVAGKATSVWTRSRIFKETGGVSGYSIGGLTRLAWIACGAVMALGGGVIANSLG